MALFIVGSYKAIPFNPDACFDPVTHVATEASFIQLLQHGVYDSKYIGYKVQLGNSVDYNNGLWVIADVNHDSANTGQSDCYDLISEDVFYEYYFGSDYTWRSCYLRKWLNNTFYPGFSTEFKNHILNPKYKSSNTWYTDDKIILPSKVEVNGGTSGAFNEGTVYPIFTDDNSRKKYGTGTTTYKNWWTRSAYTNSEGYTWIAGYDGVIKYNTNSGYGYHAPLMRVH